MVKVSLEKYLEFEKNFDSKYNDYCDIYLSIDESEAFSIERKKYLEDVLTSLYEGYTSVFDGKFYTNLSPEYLDIINSSDKTYWLEQLSHIGQCCECEGCIGTLKEIVVTLNDYYYVIDCNGTEQWQTCSKINFK